MCPNTFKYFPKLLVQYCTLCLHGILLLFSECMVPGINYCNPSNIERSSLYLILCTKYVFICADLGT